jgi:hypothetical protein
MFDAFMVTPPTTYPSEDALDLPLLHQRTTKGKTTSEGDETDFST